MSLNQEHIEPKISAKIKIYILTRAESFFTLCHDIPCSWNQSLGVEFLECIHIQYTYARYKRFQWKLEFVLIFENQFQKISHCILAVTGSSDNSEVTSNSCVSGFVEFLLNLHYRGRLTFFLAQHFFWPRKSEKMGLKSCS